MNLPATSRAIGSAAVLIAGGAMIVSAFVMIFRGEAPNQWIPWALFGLLFPTLYLVPVSLNTLFQGRSLKVRRIAMGGVFGIWILVGVVLYLSEFRNLLVYLMVAIGVIGGIAITVRTPTNPAAS